MKKQTIRFNPNLKNKYGTTCLLSWSSDQCAQDFFEYTSIHSEPIDPTLIPERFANLYVTSLRIKGLKFEEYVQIANGINIKKQQFMDITEVRQMTQELGAAKKDLQKAQETISSLRKKLDDLRALVS